MTNYSYLYIFMNGKVPMIRLKTTTARTLTSIIAALTLSASMPFNTAFAAPIEEDFDPVSLSSNSIEDNEIIMVLKALETYNKTGKKEDLDIVNALIQKLSPKQRRRLYAYLSKTINLNDYQDEGLLCFDETDNTAIPQAIPVYNNSSDYTEEIDEPEDITEEVPDNTYDIYREPVFRNKESGIIAPYNLYDPELTTTSFQFTINNSTVYPKGSNDVTVRFFGENAAQAKELAQGKAFTLLQYMCGTDLEGESRAVSNEIATMLQADSSNMNIIIFLGGTKNYGASYFNDTLSGSRAGIYFLNTAGLTPEVKEKLSSIDFMGKTSEITSILEGKTADTENICKGLKYEDIINAKTLIPLAAISEIDMADPSLLSGFINLSTKLFPADNYGLTLNNHGGGYENGIIFTEQLEKDGAVVINTSSIGPEKLESALASSDLFRDRSLSEDGKFTFIFYDACLMGTVEQVYNMRDYTRYMIGSEEVGLGTTDYKAIVNNLNTALLENPTDRAVSISVSKGYGSQFVHGGAKDGLIGSTAVFSSDAIDDTVTRINALSKDFSYVLGDNGCSDSFKNDVFKAIRKAALSSYKDGNVADSGTDFRTMILYESTIDMGDFYNYLKINMSGITGNSGNYSSADKEVLDRINQELDAVLNSGFLVYLSTKTFESFGAVTKTDNEGIIPLNFTVDTDKNVWSDVRFTDGSQKVYPYGASMLFSIGLGSDSFKSQYMYNALKDGEMGAYCQFVADFLKFNENPEGYNKQKQELAKEMSASPKYSKLITQQEGTNGYTTTLTDENNKTYTYISFKIADTYEEAGLTPPEHSTGSPILDIIDTQPGIWLTSVHKEYFDYQDSNNGDGRLSVDMICAEQRIKHYNIAAGSNTIYFNASNPDVSITSAYSLYGSPLNVLTQEIGNEDWQFVLLSSLESNKDEKKKAMSVVSTDESYVSDSLSINGSVLNADNTSFANVYHFFNLADGNYKYLGSALKNENEYVNVSDGIAISAYHYVLREEKNGEDVVRTYKEVLEGHDGFFDGFYSLKDKSQIGLRMTNVTEYDPDTYSYSGLSTAYMLDIGGTGTDYSQIAYVDTPKTYENGDNLGNGQLGKIDINSANPSFIDSIGTKITDATLNNGDTENPSMYVEEEKPFIKDAKEAAPAEISEPAIEKSADENISEVTSEEMDSKEETPEEITLEEVTLEEVTSKEEPETVQEETKDDSSESPKE